VAARRQGGYHVAALDLLHHVERASTGTTEADGDTGGNPAEPAQNAMSRPSWPLLRTWWRRTKTHLSDDRLLGCALGATTEPTDGEASLHLHDCERCADRFDELTGVLQRVSEVADAGFDAHFPPARLQVQRARIGHRLAQAVGAVDPARVIRFPFIGRPLRPLHVRRGGWLTAAAAAGLLLGVTAGQLVHYHPGSADSTASAPAGANAAVSPDPAAGLDPMASKLDMTGTVELPPSDTDWDTETTGLTLSEFGQIMADEEFLGSLDVALTSLQVAELESIDALTPRVRDLSVNLR
jgi:hypothetical protein